MQSSERNKLKLFNLIRLEVMPDSIHSDQNDQIILIRMDESADARRILTAVPQSDWRRPVGRPHSSWMATLKNDLSLHNLTYEDAIEMALDKPLWGLLAASWATHWWCMPNNNDDDEVMPDSIHFISLFFWPLMWSVVGRIWTKHWRWYCRH